MNNLTETQKNFRKQMELLDPNYKKNNSNNSNKKNIIITLIIFLIIATIFIFKNRTEEQYKYGNNNYNNNKHEIVGNYIKDYKLDDVILTYGKFIERMNNQDTYNIIEEIKSEMIYVESYLNTLKEYEPNTILNEVHIYAKLYLEQLLYSYNLIIIDFYNPKLQETNNLLNKIYNDYRNKLIELADSINMKYTKLNDGTINFEWKIYK